MFLSDATLSTAVSRLGENHGRPRLGDYLIFRRALVRTTVPDTPTNGALASDAPIPPPGVTAPTSEPVLVRTGLTSPPFVYAVDELALCVPHDNLDAWAQQPYFIPFGAKKTPASGYKTYKFPSNGTDNTADNWQTKPFTPVVLQRGTSPREWEVVSGSAEELETFLLFPPAARHALEKPRLFDAACWWLRFWNFDTPPTEVGLVERFTSDLRLTDLEVAALFAPVSDDDVLELGEAMGDPKVYLPPAAGGRIGNAPRPPHQAAAGDGLSSPPVEAVSDVIDYIASQGFVFEPWQVAAYITAIRTKPFVILAGISGTGKTKLPRLVAEATGSKLTVVPVQPSWTDSSDVIGFERLSGTFAPGYLLRCAAAAQGEQDAEHVLLLDELNIARVEYYLAEVLSLIEERHNEGGHIVSPPLVPNASLGEDGTDWTGVRLPSNLALIGSVNMDETTFGFSKKVLDRSFVIEFSTVDLGIVGDAEARPTEPNAWPVEWWQSPSLTLAAHPERTHEVVTDCIGALTTINELLAVAQLQVGYRVRDEIAMFCIHAQPYLDMFVTRDEEPIDPLDLAITMKVLPRIQGGGPTIRGVLDNLTEWATARTPAFPMCAERIAIMRQRLDESGFASYWL